MLLFNDGVDKEDDRGEDDGDGVYESLDVDGILEPLVLLLLLFSTSTSEIEGLLRL